MATRDFLMLAAAPTATVDPQTSYAGAVYQTNGFQPGITLPAQFNKAIRQGTAGMAVLAQLIVDTLGVNVLDTGYADEPTEVDTLVAQLLATLQNIAAASVMYTHGNNSNGYWSKDPSGLITQWGSIVTDGLNVTNITLPTPFSDTNYRVIIGQVKYDGANEYTVAEDSDSPTVSVPSYTRTELAFNVLAFSPGTDGPGDPNSHATYVAYGY